ncbi:MAG: hypothetical protein NC337_01945 [Roseburia sp.]|nr:hypothetical protein [Roseburia sp.]
MERKSSISVWQLGLFEGFDRDIMVMQRDEEEVFDDAIHVFFEKEYYDAYVAMAVKYGQHRYAYHEDKLGEVVNQIFEEDILGLALHIRANTNASQIVLCDEKYLAARDLLGVRDAADSYHHLYMSAIEREEKEAVVARLWTKYVYIIGQLPDPRRKPAEGENPVFELMTMKCGKDGAPATAEDFDHESLKIFLTADSAMRFNTDKKPVSKYKLAALSQLVKGKLQVIIEPHRNYRLEYDPASIDLSAHLDIPRFDEAQVKARLAEYFEMDKLYVLLAPLYSDYRVSLGNPFLMKMDEKNIMMYLFEKYDDAVSYVLQNPTLLPVFDGTFPIGVLDKGDKLLNLEVILALADKIGVTGVGFDMDTMRAIGCKLSFIKEATGKCGDVERLVSAEELDGIRREKDGEPQYRFPPVPFYDRENAYDVSEEQRASALAYIEREAGGASYLAGRGIAELMVCIRETEKYFDKARMDGDEEAVKRYGLLMNRATIALTEALCERPYIFTLREENGEFTLKNGLAYLIVTNRFEAGRKGEGRLTPVSIDNPEFMDKLYETSKAVALTDGPNLVCLADTKLMSEVAKQWVKSSPIRAELMIYLTQGCALSYNEASYYFRRLKSDGDIFVEFVSTVRGGAYPSIGMLTIGGHTAQALADANGWNYLQAYDALLSIKEELSGASTASMMAAAVEAGDSKAEAPDTAADEEEKKGIFGKLFKK